MYVRTYVCAYVCVCMYVCMYAGMYVHMYVCVCVCVYMYVCVRTPVCVCMYYMFGHAHVSIVCNIMYLVCSSTEMYHSLIYCTRTHILRTCSSKDNRLLNIFR